MKMKNLTIALLLLVATQINAQDNKKYVASMVRNIEQLNAAKTADDFTNAANSFERIAKVETKEWLPSYYQAYALLMVGMQQADNAKKDEYYDKAGKVAEMANTISPDNSEIVTLQSFVTSMKISVDPMTRGQQLAMEAGMLTGMAIKLNPENPRPYLLKGTGTMYTPEQFGGGKDKALPILETAVQKFKAFKPENSLMPTWGAERATQMLEECKKM